MSETPTPLEYAPPALRRSPARRRSLVRVALAWFLFPLPLALALVFLFGLDPPVYYPSAPPGSVFAAADIRRGNAVGDYRVSAHGFMRGGRPVFDQVGVFFPKLSGRSLDVDATKMAFHPFADCFSSDDYRPITRAGVLAQLTSRGCDPASPATAELADALYADLQNISAGTLKPGELYTGPYVPPPDDRLLKPHEVLTGWLVFSSVMTLISFFALRPRAPDSATANAARPGGAGG